MVAACVAHTGSGAWQALPETLAALRPRLGRLPLYRAGDPGEASALAAMLAEECDVLVVFGDDGTVHEVVNGLPLGPDVEGPAVAVLPGGTGNDLVRGLGLPPEPVAAARVLAECRPRRVDLLDCGGRRAANGLNAGFAVAATQGLSRRAKRWLGPLAYVLGGVMAGVDPPTWQARLARELARNRVRAGLPRLRGQAVALVTDMPCRLDGEPMPTPAKVSVLAG